MKKLHKNYKHNIKKNTIEIKHHFVTDTNLKLTFNESINYSKEKEIELLKEIKESVIEKLINCHNLLNENIILQENLYKEMVTIPLSFITNTPLGFITSGVTSCLAIIDSEKFIKNVNEQKKLKKESFYIENESNFKTLDLNKEIKKIKAKKLSRKIEKLIKNNSQININNVNNFSQKELKKLISFK